MMKITRILVNCLPFVSRKKFNDASEWLEMETNAAEYWTKALSDAKKDLPLLKEKTQSLETENKQLGEKHQALYLQLVELGLLRKL